MKKLRILLLVLLISGLPSSNITAGIHPVQEIMYLYAGRLPYLDFIEPYRASLLALYELDNNRNVDKVVKLIDWYFANLNYPDRYNIDATVYDYHLRRDGRIFTKEEYDSIDGYSGVFLHLLLKYVELTGDLERVKNNWYKIEDIALTIPLLQEGDGLTIALVTTNQKYLMDNCEAYGGINAYLKLREMLGLYPQPSFERVRDNIKNGIMKRMYNKKDKIFVHTIENDVVYKTSWNAYYPDSYAQLFPIYYDLLTGDDNTIKYIWQRFEQKHAHKEKTFPVEQWVFYQLTRNKMQRQYDMLFTDSSII